MKAWQYAVWGALFSFAGSAQAVMQSSEVQTLQLKNGMKVLLLEDHSIPNANMYTFWKVGSRNEVPGITGLSHFFEHMMFNGSKNFPPGSFDKVMEAAGGSNNAYTTADVTVYTNWFTAAAMQTIFDLEADRIASLAIDDKKIESERGVVLSERSTGLENDPWERLYETVKSSSYHAHPYSWPVIGFESDIKAWSREDLERYFRTYYNPSNAVMVISGDIKPADVRKLLADKIEVIARNEKVPEVRTKEPPQHGEKRVFVIKESATAPQVMVAWHVPETRHADFYALDLLTEILTGGPSSRLVKLMVDDKRIASNVTADLPQAFDPTLFAVFVSGMEGKDPGTMERLLLSEIDLMKKKPVTAQELQKAKNKKVVDLYRRMETINGKSQLLGDFEVFHGGYQKLFEAAGSYEKVTPADITRILTTYFQKSNRTVGVQDIREPADFRY
ncbi:MAG TPA: pitrilysin family protein [Oligoflexus sp.]|uniref:M16 family metallopeptidase n=1 Tax=Oligoflexus sp. TaxID=1971216 RepID=UPI002D50BF46|nr:pitrilysin family protein [Oligoflexus sp.]HYX39535.1 pitrilysin family protein [Oligoflexus sp.]